MEWIRDVVPDSFSRIAEQRGWRKDPYRYCGVQPQVEMDVGNGYFGHTI